MKHDVRQIEETYIEMLQNKRNIFQLVLLSAITLQIAFCFWYCQLTNVGTRYYKNKLA